MSERGSGTNGFGVGRALRLGAATAGLALGFGVALPAAVGAQDEETEFGSVGECFAAGQGLGACIDLFVPAPVAPAPPTFGDDEDGGFAFDLAGRFPGILGADEDE